MSESLPPLPPQLRALLDAAAPPPPPPGFEARVLSRLASSLGAAGAAAGAVVLSKGTLAVLVVGLLGVGVAAGVGYERLAHPRPQAPQVPVAAPSTTPGSWAPGSAEAERALEPAGATEAAERTPGSAGAAEAGKAPQPAGATEHRSPGDSAHAVQPERSRGPLDNAAEAGRATPSAKAEEGPHPPSAADAGSGTNQTLSPYPERARHPPSAAEPRSGTPPAEAEGASAAAAGRGTPSVEAGRAPLPAGAAEASREATETPSAALPGARTGTRDTALSAERGLLEVARTALSRGDVAGALSAVQRHEAQFPRGRLVEERELLFLQALLQAGRGSEARRRAAQFRVAYPDSPLLPAVEALAPP